MNERNSREYCRKREQQERKLADATTERGVASIHRDMYKRNGQLVTEAIDAESVDRPRPKISV